MPDDSCTTTERGAIECRKILERGARFDSVLMKRPALGVQVSGTGSARDTIGLFVSSVTPKGPAENAGIVEGDRLVSINGVDLRVPKDDIEDGYANGIPSRRLQREVGKLAPGARANVRVYSGGRVRDVQVTVGRASDMMRNRSFINIGDMPGGMIWGDRFDMFPGNTRIMQLGPELERMRMTLPKIRMRTPDMQRLREMIPEMRRMDIEDLPMLEPGGIYRLRDRDEERRKEKERGSEKEKSKK
ncbi:MAG TPA: PDZ domain-containing protein [Gemmatimonadaceae bacterium]|nr:PDZ domain-containing protein [Gemmatimonadaceae bacterium]